MAKGKPRRDSKNVAGKGHPNSNYIGNIIIKLKRIYTQYSSFI